MQNYHVFTVVLLFCKVANLFLGASPAIPEAPSTENIHLPIPAKMFRPQRSVCLVAVSATPQNTRIIPTLLTL